MHEGIVLDIGAADRWVERHVPPNNRYVALDYPATGRTMYQSKPDIFGDGCKLPLSDGCMDCVVCLEVIEHVREPEALISEIERVLRPGGMLWLSAPFLYPVHDAPHDYRRLTEHGLQLMLSRRKLQVVHLRRHGHGLRTAGLNACLALAGPLENLNGAIRIPYVLIAGILIPVINCMAWLASFIWPVWDAMPMVYEIEVRRR